MRRVQFEENRGERNLKRKEVSEVYFKENRKSGIEIE